MCGIIGSVRFGSCLDESVSLSMRDSLEHRGPDDAGLWQSPACGVTLGSRRLAILDLSPRGHQSNRRPAGPLDVVFRADCQSRQTLPSDGRDLAEQRSRCDRHSFSSDLRRAGALLVVGLLGSKHYGPGCGRCLPGRTPTTDYSESGQRDNVGNRHSHSGIVTALLAILVIHTIDKNQQARFDKICTRRRSSHLPLMSEHSFAQT